MKHEGFQDMCCEALKTRGAKLNPLLAGLSNTLGGWCDWPVII